MPGAGGSALQPGEESGGSEPGPDGVSVPASACGLTNAAEARMEARPGPRAAQICSPRGIAHTGHVGLGSSPPKGESETWKEKVGEGLRTPSRPQTRLHHSRDPEVVQGAGTAGAASWLPPSAPTGGGCWGAGVLCTRHPILPPHPLSQETVPVPEPPGPSAAG